MDEQQLILELIKQGALGTMLVLALLALYRKDKAVTDAYDKRVEDNNKLATVIEATNAAARALEVTSENRSRVIESVGEATRATADAVKSQAAILEQLRSVVEKTNQATALLREDFDSLEKNLSKDLDALRGELLVGTRRSGRVTRKGPSRP
jgi:uncharacterized phage infection (PIP) family protein YhgE